MRALSYERLRQAIVVTAIVLGAVERLYLPLAQGEYGKTPYLLGGLYAHIANLISNNHWLLPHFFEGYSFRPIPLVYPPLGFYVWAGLHELGISYVTLSIFSGAVLAILGLAAFYFMSRNVLESPWAATFATVTYALVADAFLHTILPGGGYVGGLGVLFLMVTAGLSVRLFKNPHYQMRLAIAAGLSLGLSGMSSPGGRRERSSPSPC